MLPHTYNDQVDYECELAVVIGILQNVAAKDALDYVLGYTCANDVSARIGRISIVVASDQRQSFDTFARYPILVTADIVPNHRFFPSHYSTKIRGQPFTGI